MEDRERDSDEQPARWAKRIRRAPAGRAGEGGRESGMPKSRYGRSGEITPGATSLRGKYRIRSNEYPRNVGPSGEDNKSCERNTVRARDRLERFFETTRATARARHAPRGWFPIFVPREISLNVASRNFLHSNRSIRRLRE